MRSDPFQADERISAIAGVRYFTDRDDAIGAVQRAVATPSGEPLRALVFFGVGGIGKTALLHRIADALPETFPRALVDLRSIGDRTVAYRETLLRLRTDLGRRFALDFPRFDLCVAVMLEREGGEPPPLVRMNPKLSGLLGAMVGLAKAIPGPLALPVQAVEGVIKGALEAFPALGDLIRRTGGMTAFADLRKRAAHDDPALPADLIRRFVQDLAEALPERSDHACRGVIFLDTYEHLWTGRDAAASQSRALDWWVVDLVRFCLHERVGVLPVIAGRDSLRWANDDPALADLIVQYPLGGLGPHDAQSFLARCGIGLAAGAPPSPVQTAVIRCCDTRRHREPSCHPLYLALCAEIVVNTRRATGGDPPPEIFDGVPEREIASALAARFLTSLHSSAMESWVKDLCLTPRFDETAALALDAARQHYNGRPGWERLVQFSFVEPQPGGFYRLHTTMRAALQELARPDQAGRVHEWFADHWAERQEDALAWFHRWTLDPGGSLAAWRRDIETAFATAQIAEARRLLSLWSDVALDEHDRRLLGDTLWAETHVALALELVRTPVVHRQSALTAAIQHLQTALPAQTEAGWARTHIMLALALSQLPAGDREQHLRQAIASCEAALGVYTEAAFPRDRATVRLVLAQIYGELPAGDRDENLRRAIAYCEAALQAISEADAPHDWATGQATLGNAYLRLQDGDRQDHLRRAIACYDAALPIVAGAPGMFAEIQVNLGTAYSDLLDGDREANLKYAVLCYEAALEVFTEADFPEQWAALQNNLGSVVAGLPSEDQEENLRHAIAYFEAATRVHTEADFPREWARLQANLGRAYALLETGERVEYLRRAIACYEGALRVYSPAAYPQDRPDVEMALADAKATLASLSDGGATSRP
ncbi:MAG: hypothetical protein QN178_07985 [Armatimonadota bacterium]|nr:hypothetical protein [Armatimonadota bacterium]